MYGLNKKYYNGVVGLVILVLNCFPLFGQDQNDSFQKTYIKVATELTHSQPAEALRIADSLYQNSTDQQHKLSALMLSANVFYRIHDLKEAFHYAKRAERIAKEVKNYDWQIRIHGFYSSLYREIGFYDEGFKHLEIVSNLSTKLKDSRQKTLVKMLNAQAKAYFLFIQGEENQVLEVLTQAQTLYPKMKELSVGRYHIANSEELMGRIYLNKKDYDKSKTVYQKALSYLDEYDNANYPIYGYIYIGMMVLQLEQSDLEKAKEYLGKAKTIVEKNNVTDLKLFYNKHVLSYFQAVEDWESYRDTQNLIIQLEAESDREKKLMYASLFGDIQQRQTSTQQQRNIFLASGIGLFMMIIGVLIYYRKRNKNKRKYVEQILTEVDLLKKAKPKSIKKANNTQENTSSELGIAQDTLQRILESLEDFEKDTVYLHENTNAMTIAHYCQTNVRYISQIVNQYKNENVNAYINRLRVTYILKKIKEDPVYRTYKISHLADEAGFSSHSKFSAEFKRIIGMSPSLFITRLIKSEK